MELLLGYLGYVLAAPSPMALTESVGTRGSAFQARWVPDCGNDRGKLPLPGKLRKSLKSVPLPLVQFLGEPQRRRGHREDGECRKAQELHGQLLNRRLAQHDAAGQADEVRIG